MEILKFRTNISNEPAILKIEPIMNRFENIHSWQVDTSVEEKILSISGKDINPQLIQNALQEIGYQAELMRALGLGGTDL